MGKKKYKDIEIGDIFTELKVIKYDGRRGNPTKDYWNCECSCGNTTVTTRERLNNGTTKSCGCLIKKNKILQPKDLTGITTESGIEFIKQNGRRGKGNTITWNCLCFCGNHFTEVPANVFSGKRKSCGCLNSINISKAKTTKTFYDWCIENDKQNYLKLWDYVLNNDTPKDISYKNSKQRYFHCMNNNIEHKSELKYISHIVNRGDSNLFCHQCNSFAQWSINNLGEDFLKKYWDYDKNTNNPFDISYSSGKKVWIKCQEKDYHQSYEVACNKFISGNRCPLCNKNSGKLHILDSFGEKYPFILPLWSDKNTKTPYEYSPCNGNYCWLKCPNGIHKDYKTKINNAVKCDFRCPECTKMLTDSILQSKVNTYLVETGYEVVTEYNCNISPINPKTGYALLFDNEIIDLNLVIEVHGIQHYECGGFHKLQAEHKNTTPEQEFEYGLWKDKYKKEYALSKGYYYLEIPYWTEKDESYKELIENKINEILEDKKSA